MLHWLVLAWIRCRDWQTCWPIQRLRFLFGDKTSGFIFIIFVLWVYLFLFFIFTSDLCKYCLKFNNTKKGLFSVYKNSRSFELDFWAFKTTQTMEPNTFFRPFSSSSAVVFLRLVSQATMYKVWRCCRCWDVCATCLSYFAVDLFCFLTDPYIHHPQGQRLCLWRAFMCVLFMLPCEPNTPKQK